MPLACTYNHKRTGSSWLSSQLAYPWTSSQWQVLQSIPWQWFQNEYKHTWTVFSVISTGLAMLGLEALSTPVLKLFLSLPQLQHHLATGTAGVSNHQQLVTGAKLEAFNQQHGHLGCVVLCLMIRDVEVPVKWKPMQVWMAAFQGRIFNKITILQSKTENGVEGVG